MMLRDGERLDYVNDKIELIQNGEGLTFGTDALLLASYVDGRYKDAVELGGGSGIISLLLLTRAKAQEVTCLEVQPEYAELIRRNAEHNSLSDRLRAVCCDVREYTPESECELVVSNPPYMKATSGKMCHSDKKSIARHELFGDISDFAVAGAKMLKYGGSMVFVYRPDRLVDLICAMRAAGIEPKRMTLVLADSASVPSMALIEGKRGGRCGLKMTPPLIIYSDREHRQYSADMQYIMENGSFPKGFKKG